jgi:CheY-like chemotaxis protein
METQMDEEEIERLTAPAGRRILDAEQEETFDRMTLARSEFLANMSQELRTPLTAVLGFSQLIREQPDLTDESRAYLDRVSDAGRVLLAIVGDILDFSKLEAGQIEIKRRPVSPARVATDALNQFALQAADKDVGLAAVGLETLPAVVPLDADRLRQILLNLIGNAMKFTEDGSVTLEGAYDPVKGRLSFAVVDTGPGIVAADVPRLFQRFARVDGSSARKHGGTGLGLAICKGLVDAMGGEIGVDSEPGQGSRFWFFVPAPRMQAPSGPDRASTRETDIPAGCRVLVADDNAMNRALARAVLGACQIQVVEVEDGEQALRAARAAPFDVILMDLRMPNLDGVGAAQRIRAEDGPNRATPILSFSADVAAELPEGLFDGAVVKPISSANLVSAIAQVVGARSKVHAAA